MAKEGHLPPQDAGWTKTSAPIEHGTPLKILPVEMMRRKTTFPYFPVYLILLLLVFFFLVKFCYNIFSAFLNLKGQVLKTLRKESLALTGKDLTGSCHGRGRAPTTSRCWMDRNFSIHGTRSAFGNTTGRDNVKDDDEPPISLFI